MPQNIHYAYEYSHFLRHSPTEH